MNIIKTNLFIGGPCDGHRKEFPDAGPALEVGIRVPVSTLYDTAETHTPLQSARYRRETVSVGDVAAEVWVWEEMEPGAVLAELVAGYRPARRAVTP